MTNEIHNHSPQREYTENSFHVVESSRSCCSSVTHVAHVSEMEASPGSFISNEDSTGRSEILNNISNDNEPELDIMEDSNKRNKSDDNIKASDIESNRF